MNYTTFFTFVFISIFSFQIGFAQNNANPADEKAWVDRIFNSMSDVTAQEAVFGAQRIDFESTNKLALNLNVGTYIHLGNQKIDFNIMYQPENEFELVSTDNLSRIESNYKMSGFQLKATYVF